MPAGRSGRGGPGRLRAGKADFVILEANPERFAEARDQGYLCLQADATEEEALKQAGIMRARALATVVPTDAINVFITLSARGLNSGLQIIARGESPSTEKKLLQAGADNVVLPAHIGAETVASLILYPGLADVFSHSERRRQTEQDLRSFGLELEVVSAAEGSSFVGLTVEEIERQAERSFFIVAIERRGRYPGPIRGRRLRQALAVQIAIRPEPGDGIAESLKRRARRVSQLGLRLGD